MPPARPSSGTKCRALGRYGHREFLALNPAGQMPVVVLDDGRPLAQSNAILRYLAHGSRFIPADRYDAAKVDEWLFWEQYSHEPTVAVARARVVYDGQKVSPISIRLWSPAPTRRSTGWNRR